MNYSTPKVTIDLAEYSDLLEIKEKHNSTSELLMAKLVICAFVNSYSGTPPNMFTELMNLYGVSLQLIMVDREKGVSPDAIRISLLPNHKDFKTA